MLDSQDVFIIDESETYDQIRKNMKLTQEIHAKEIKAVRNHNFCLGFSLGGAVFFFLGILTFMSMTGGFKQ